MLEKAHSPCQITKGPESTGSSDLKQDIVSAVETWVWVELSYRLVCFRMEGKKIQCEVACQPAGGVRKRHSQDSHIQGVPGQAGARPANGLGER